MTQIGLGLREVQDLGAIRIHGGAGLAGVEPALVDLGDVGDEVDFRAAGLSQDLGETLEQIIVGYGLERPFVLHAENIGRVFSTSRLAA